MRTRTHTLPQTVAPNGLRSVWPRNFGPKSAGDLDLARSLFWLLRVCLIAWVLWFARTYNHVGVDELWVEVCVCVCGDGGGAQWSVGACQGLRGSAKV